MPRVRDLLARKRARGASLEVISIGPDATVLEAAQLMTERGIGGLLVVHPADAGAPSAAASAFAGIFTERDILRRVVGGQRDPAATRVRDVMTSDVLTVEPGTPVAECRALFTNRRIRHLPVVEADGRVSGMLTSGDVLAFEADEQRTAIEHLEGYVYNSR